MNMNTALQELGAHENLLSDKEKTELDENGFTLFHDMISKDELQEFRERFEFLIEKEGKHAGCELGKKNLQPSRLLANVCNKGEIYDKVYTNPRLLAAIHYVLKDDFHISSLNSRDAAPGKGHQAFHQDGKPAKAIGDYNVCNSIWLLDDFTLENGCTRLVPGSHNFFKTPKSAMDDPKEKHPDEIYLVAPAGTVCVFNSHLWHGGTINTTENPRRALHCYFTSRTEKQQTNQMEHMRLTTWKRLSPAARYILGVDTE
ncbi:MAG: phytanoyl-CoA dioxygenase family protein [Lentisphaeria bacterium]|nr:phytanoyl-CoA dioxygenase family protein [Lentisphaeria bacterium]NQZ70275.1 phytanoyl-CoA dioxygenase family protein [Lentisphaeria bacterium]